MTRRPDPWAKLATEKANPRSRHLDLMKPEAVARLIASEDARAIAAVRCVAPAIAAAARLFAEAVVEGKRIAYIGAGTSGRLGVIDAAELPPTFGMPRQGRKAVIGIMAGGSRALRRSAEGAEDDAATGRRAVARLGFGAGDLLIGISASSLAPFVRAALEEAKRRGSGTVLVTMNRVARPRYVDLLIAPVVGPEVLAGSTRMKAGLATKAVLHNLSTTAMVLAGKVYGNRMVDLKMWCAKLVARGERLVAELGGVSRPVARRLLREAHGDLKAAIVMAHRECEHHEAVHHLRAAKGRLRHALPPRRRR